MPKYWGKQIFTHERFSKVGQKQKKEKNTPGTVGGPGGRDRTPESKKAASTRAPLGEPSEYLEEPNLINATQHET